MAAVITKLEMDKFDENKVPRLIAATFTTGEKALYHRIGEELRSKSIVTQVIQKKYEFCDQKDNEKYYDSLASKFQLLDTHYKSVLEDAERLVTQSSMVQINAAKDIQSSILNEKVIAWLQSTLQEEGWVIGKRLFSTAEYGNSAEAFHKNCDDKGATLTVIKATHGAVFGGFTSTPWSSQPGYAIDQRAWLFRVDEDACKRIGVKANFRDLALFHNAQYGPTFGRGHDLVVHGGSSNRNYCKVLSYTNGILSDYCNIVKFGVQLYEVFQIQSATQEGVKTSKGFI